VIKASGKTVNAIVVEAGVSQPILHRFAKGERDLTIGDGRQARKVFPS
jgi:hypothetical protein